MGILLIISLLLAWPTAGASILIFIVIATIKKIIKIKAKQYDTKKTKAKTNLLNGEIGYPSWINDKEKTDIFIEAIYLDLSRKNVPLHYYKEIINKNESARTIFYYAYTLEKEGASFIEQELAVSELILSLWNKEIEKIKSKRIHEHKKSISQIAKENRRYKIEKIRDKNKALNFHYMMEKKKTRITQQIEKSKINKKSIKVSFQQANDYYNTRDPKISILLLYNEIEGYGESISIKINFFKINKTTEKVITLIMLLHTKMRDDLFLHLSNGSIKKTDIVGDDLEPSLLTKVLLKNGK